MRGWVSGIVLLAGLGGCGSQKQVCTPAGPAYSVTPATALKDHDAFAPGNQQQFIATSMAGSSPGCATPQVIERLTPGWTVSDPIHVQISSAQDTTNGLAICLGATKGPVTVTARIETGTSADPVIIPLSASLFCE